MDRLICHDIGCSRTGRNRLLKENCYVHPYVPVYRFFDVACRPIRYGPAFAEANSINLIRTDQRCNDFRSEFCQFRGFLTDRSNFTITRSHST